MAAVDAVGKQMEPAASSSSAAAAAAEAAVKGLDDADIPASKHYHYEKSKTPDAPVLIVDQSNGESIKVTHKQLNFCTKFTVLLDDMELQLVGKKDAADADVKDEKGETVMVERYIFENPQVTIATENDSKESEENKNRRITQKEAKSHTKSVVVKDEDGKSKVVAVDEETIVDQSGDPIKETDDGTQSGIYHKPPVPKTFGPGFTAEQRTETIQDGRRVAGLRNGDFILTIDTPAKTRTAIHATGALTAVGEYLRICDGNPTITPKKPLESKDMKVNCGNTATGLAIANWVDALWPAQIIATRTWAGVTAKRRFLHVYHIANNLGCASLLRLLFAKVASLIKGDKIKNVPTILDPLGVNAGAEALILGTGFRQDESKSNKKVRKNGPNRGTAADGTYDGDRGSSAAVNSGDYKFPVGSSSGGGGGGGGGGMMMPSRASSVGSAAGGGGMVDRKSNGPTPAGRSAPAAAAAAAAASVPPRRRPGAAAAAAADDYDSDGSDESSDSKDKKRRG